MPYSGRVFSVKGDEPMGVFYPPPPLGNKAGKSPPWNPSDTTGGILSPVPPMWCRVQEANRSTIWKYQRTSFANCSIYRLYHLMCLDFLSNTGKQPTLLSLHPRAVQYILFPKYACPHLHHRQNRDIQTPIVHHVPRYSFHSNAIDNICIWGLEDVVHQEI